MTTEIHIHFPETFNQKPRVNIAGRGLDELQENGKSVITLEYKQVLSNAKMPTQLNKQYKHCN